MSIFIGNIEVDPGVLAKLNSKHNISEAELRESLMWPAVVRTAHESDPTHGARWIAKASTAEGRELFAALLPLPPYAGEAAEDWLVKTAIWLDA